MAKTEDLEQIVLDYINEVKPYHTKIIDIELDYVATENVNIGGNGLTSTFTDMIHWDIDILNPGFNFIPGNYTFHGWDDVLWDDLSWDFSIDLSFLPLTIIDVDTFENYFILSGDFSSKFKYGYQFLVEDSFQNNKNWYVLKSIYDSNLNITKIYTLHDIIYGKVPSSTFVGRITNLVPRPYVNTGFDVEKTVRCATTTTLPSYVKTGSGIGATLTATSNGLLNNTDGVEIHIGDRILVKDEIGSNKVNNGIYNVIATGSYSSKYVLTRVIDDDQYLPGEMSNGLVVMVSEGAIFTDSAFMLVTPNPITLEITQLDFNQITVSNLYRLPKHNYEVRVVITEHLSFLDDFDMNVYERSGSDSFGNIWDSQRWDNAPWDADFNTFTQFSEKLTFQWTDTDTFTYPITTVRALQLFPIKALGINPINSIFFEGNVTSTFTTGISLDISNTTVNNRTYIVLSSTFNGTDTEVFLNGNIYDVESLIVGIGNAIVGNEVLISGNHYLAFPKDYNVNISASSFNNGSYTVSYAYYNGVNTVIRFNEVLPSQVADGNVVK